MKPLTKRDYYVLSIELNPLPPKIEWVGFDKNTYPYHATTKNQFPDRDEQLDIFRNEFKNCPKLDNTKLRRIVKTYIKKKVASVKGFVNTYAAGQNEKILIRKKGRMFLVPKILVQKDKFLKPYALENV